MNTPLLDVHFRRQHSVRWCDTDASGFVHFANYLRYMEETEYEFLRSLGLSIVMTDERGILGFPRVSTCFEVKNPARFDQSLQTWLQVERADGKSISYRFETESQGTVVAIGQFEVCCCRFSPGKLPRAILIPKFFLDRLPINARDQVAEA